MAELGRQLKAAREEQELPLEGAAEATRIPLNYLMALEEERFNTFSSDLHARGFLRNYAAYLGLDVDGLLQLYDQMHGRTPAAKVAHRDVAGPAGSPARRGSTLFSDLMLALVVIGALALAGLSMYQRRTLANATPTAGPPPTPTVTPVPILEAMAYTMDVYLDYDAHRLDVRQRIDYTNVTSETLANLMLNVHPNCSRRTFQLNDIKVDVDGELVQPEVFPLDVTLRVALPRDLKPGAHETLYFDFTLDLPAIAADAEFSQASHGYSKRTVSLGNWYPVLAPYREDKGWYGLTCFQIGDPYVTEVADYHVTITTTEEVVIAGTGVEMRNGNRWHFEAPQARSFAFAASDRYQVTTRQVGDVAVHAYYFPEHQGAAEAALDTAGRALELFAELYGPYPYADYRLAETEFAGGMEFTGLTFLGAPFYEQYDGSGRSALVALTAHEASHQWFYSLVGSDQVTEPWLDESIAEYSAYLYYERHLPDDTAWWWDYAVEQWVPTGIIDARIHEFRNNRGYMDAVYRRGALFVRDLRALMGDPAFFGFLKEYERRNAYRLATSRDFFALVQEFTTADLVPLQEEYFRQRIVP